MPTHKLGSSATFGRSWRQRSCHEHNLDVIKTADYIIDLGPEGGDKGGTLVAFGTPEEVAKVKTSYTGQYVKQALAQAKKNRWYE